MENPTKNSMKKKDKTRKRFKFHAWVNRRRGMSKWKFPKYSIAHVEKSKAYAMPIKYNHAIPNKILMDVGR